MDTILCTIVIFVRFKVHGPSVWKGKIWSHYFNCLAIWNTKYVCWIWRLSGVFLPNTIGFATKPIMEQMFCRPEVPVLSSPCSSSCSSVTSRCLFQQHFTKGFLNKSVLVFVLFWHKIVGTKAPCKMCCLWMCYSGWTVIPYFDASLRSYLGYQSVHS